MERRWHVTRCPGDVRAAHGGVGSADHALARQGRRTHQRRSGVPHAHPRAACIGAGGTRRDEGAGALGSRTVAQAQRALHAGRLHHRSGQIRRRARAARSRRAAVTRDRIHRRGNRHPRAHQHAHRAQPERERGHHPALSAAGTARRRRDGDARLRWRGA